jgi:hypothetical protein
MEGSLLILIDDDEFALFAIRPELKIITYLKAQ